MGSVSVSRSAIARAIETVGELAITRDAIMAGVAERDARGISYLITPAEASPKLAHNGGHVELISGVMYLRARTDAGRGNLCPAADSGCVGCYGYGGRAAMFSGVNVARQARVDFMADAPELFMAALAGEIAAIVAACGDDFRAAVRLNGLSDIAWENVPAGDAACIMHAFPAVRFWDYTRVPGRINPWAAGSMPRNLDLTFSLGADNDRIAARALAAGMKVAAVFRRPFERDTWHGLPVINGDAHDFRFLESGPAIVALKAKGPARRDRSGFVREIDSAGLELERVPRFGRAAS